MTTRRTVRQDPIPADQTSPKDEATSDITPAVPRAVIAKLLGFTAAMVVCPIGSYFLTLNSLFGGNSTYAGALAAVTANLVLIGYVVVAFRDDQREREAEEAEKKGR